MRRIFITGAGTEVGKTVVTCALAHQYTLGGYLVSALKPVVSGFDWDDRKSDPARILASMNMPAGREEVMRVSRWRFAAPLSPHLAAREEGVEVSLAEVAQYCRDAAAGADVQLIEGAGGVCSPLTDDALNLDLARALDAEALLVSGSYLGAITHALSAAAALREACIPLGGIIVSASAGGRQAALEETADSIRRFAKSDAPVYTLPRLAGDAPWRDAPPLAHYFPPGPR